MKVLSEKTNIQVEPVLDTVRTGNLREQKTIEHYVPILKQAFTIRMLEESLLRLFSEGKLFGTVHTCIGQEFVGVAVGRCLQKEDYVFSNHRCHGHFLSYGGALEGLIAEIMGKATGVCGGRGGSQHLHQHRFFSNGVQGGIAPVAAGLALSQKLEENQGIAVVFLGDGTLGEGALYETMNLASKWELPLLFVLENNLYAQSTSQQQTLAGGIEERFQAFGIATTKSDTWNWETLLQDMEASVNFVRAFRKPRFHQVDTYRLEAHSKGDDDRDVNEVESYRKRDPLVQILEEYGEKEPLKSMMQEIRQRLEAVIQKAEAAPFGEVSTPGGTFGDSVRWEEKTFERERVVVSIQKALDEALSNNDRVILIGEDIEVPYGGAFKVTGDLSAHYPGRVRNTPISEAAIVGMGNGLALAGFIPVVEIMFGDFLTLAADQFINQAAKFYWMYNEQVIVPLIIRTPMGGRRGYGPTHSQSLEKHFLGLPHTQVLCLHHRYSPYLLYQTLCHTVEEPTLVIENKTLYSHYVDPQPLPGYQLYHTDERFPTTWLRSEVPADVTMVVIGGLSLEAEKALDTLFEEEEVIVDIFLPTCLYPLDVSFLKESLAATRRLVVAEEGQGFVSISSEILAQVAEKFGHLNIKSQRLTARANPIPTSRPQEETCLPGNEMIVQSILEMISE